MATLGAGGARPHKSPRSLERKVLFLFLFLCISHQLGTFQSWACPVFTLAPWSSPGVLSSAPPHPSCPFAVMHPLPCHRIAATCPCADDAPHPCSSIPLQRCVPLQRRVLCPHSPCPLHPPLPPGPPACGKATPRWTWDGDVTLKVGGTEGASTHAPQLAPWARPPLGASVQLLKIESENIRVPSPDGETEGGGSIPASTGRTLSQRLVTHPSPQPPLSPTRRCPSPRSGWIPFGFSLGEIAPVALSNPP